MELDGISKACRTKVMMNSPVTSTAASEARNSTVVSRGFSSGLFSFLVTCLGTGPFPTGALSALSNHSKRAVPPGHLKQMGRRIGEVNEFITGSRRSRHVLIRVSDRPVDEQRTSDDIFLGHEPPVATVQTLVPIIAQNKIISLRNDEFTVLDQFLHLQPPASFQTRNGKVKPGELIAESVVHTRAVADVGFHQSVAVDIHLPVDQADAVSRHADDALHKVLRGMHGIAKNNNVSPFYLPVRHEEVPQAASAVAQFVDQEIVPDQQRVLHRFGGNLERLHDESNDKNRDDHRRQQRLQRTQRVRVRRFYLNSYCHGGHWACSLRFVLPLAPTETVPRYSSTWRAASCSAFFLVEPSARPTNSALPPFSSGCRLASTVKVLLCSGPRSFTSV